MERLNEWVDLEGLLEVLPGNWSKRYVYYLIVTKQIPHFKPTKRKLLFNLNDVEKWLQKSRIEEAGE